MSMVQLSILRGVLLFATPQCLHRCHLDLSPVSTTSVLRRTWFVWLSVVDFFESQLNFHQTSGIFSLFLGLYHFLNALSFKLLQYYNFYFVAEPRA